MATMLKSGLKVGIVRNRAFCQFSSIAQMLALWSFRYHSRLALREMDDWQLKDIGLMPQDARTEMRKPFWKA